MARKVWIYDEDLNQVTVQTLDRALGSTPAALLAGSKEIEQAFELSDQGEKDGLEWVEATPREQESNFERIRMGFGFSGLESMELADSFGQTTVLKFTALRRNPKLDPGAVQVRAAQGRRRDRRLSPSLSDGSSRELQHRPRRTILARSSPDCADAAAPLAEAMRPQSLADVVGQPHLLGPGKPLRLAFESGKPHSMILWGPPGVGKTTLARLMAERLRRRIHRRCPRCFPGSRTSARQCSAPKPCWRSRARHTILFVDEVHRFNKAQQDAFLPFVEQGLFTFIGATTENPSFEVNSALLSRAAVYVLKSLERRRTRAAVRARREPARSPACNSTRMRASA